MTNYNVLVEKRVMKALQAMEPKLRQRMKSAVKSLAQDPFTKRSGCDIKQLHGRKRDFYRLRIGDYRAIYTVAKQEVKVTDLIPRKKGYSFLD